MTYHIDRTAQLSDAVAKGYRSLASSLRSVGTPTRQHKAGKKTAAKKTAAKKAAAKKTETKPAAKKATAKKTTTKKS